MYVVDWSLLRSFLAVVETGSLSGAAKSIVSTQPTLSRHVRELEALLGVVLFERTVSGLIPTNVALDLIEDVRSMGVAAQASTLKAQGRSTVLAGPVRLTASIMMSNYLLPDILAALRAAEPQIQIELVPTDSNQSLLRRDADIALRMAKPEQAALVARRLGSAPMGLYAARSYLDRAGTPSTLSDLRNHDLIGLDRADFFIRALEAAGLSTTRDSFAFRCDDQTSYWNLLSAGCGIGFSQTLIAQRHPHIAPAGVDISLSPMPVWLVTSEEIRTNPRIRRAAEFLGDALATMFNEGYPT